MRAYTKDIFRNISHSKKRFLAIALITLLGVMMFSGLQASCNDLEKSADAFFRSSETTVRKWVLKERSSHAGSRERSEARSS